MAIEKKEGATMTCQNCKTELVCHMSTYEGDFQNKLQWQNPDGSAHYKWNGVDDKGNAKFKCMLPETDTMVDKKSTQTVPQEHISTDNQLNEEHLKKKQEEIKNKPTVPTLEDDKAAKVISETELLNSIDTLVMATLKQYEVSPSPQKAGSFTKIIYDTYFAPKFEKASKI